MVILPDDLACFSETLYVEKHIFQILKNKETQKRQPKPAKILLFKMISLLVTKTKIADIVL